MCVIYRGCNVQHVSSSWITVSVCLSLFTSVLVTQAPSLIFFLLCSQISVCQFHLLSPPLLLSDTLALYVRQGHIIYLTIRWILLQCCFMHTKHLLTWKIFMLAGPSSPSGMVLLDAPFRPHLRSASRESSTRWWVAQYWVRSVCKAARFSLSSVSCCSRASSWYSLSLSAMQWK